MDLFEASILWSIPAGALVLLLWQVIFHYRYFYRLVKFKPKPPAKNQSGVSVILCARNEKENLTKNLPLILEQDYPNFEVIVVDDASWDGTDEVLTIFKDKYPNLRIVTIMEHVKKGEGKKFALTLGIKTAQNNILLLTDADCKPVSDKWIQYMAAPYEDSQIEMVLGYSPYETRSNLLNLLIRAETSLTAMLYMSFALRKKPYMGVGRNLSYTKELFFRNKGFATHYHIPSGDDDLFVRDSSTKNNVAIAISPEARMVSRPKNTFIEWFRQKKRHLFVGKYYKPEIKRSLFSFTFSHFLFWILIALTLIFIKPWWIGIGIVLLKWLATFPVVYMATRKIGYRFLAFFLPLLDIAYLFYGMFSGLVYLFSKKPKW
jgi:poly-beta-1,6-N-acetyl-D-glucosamine synthase